MNCEHPLRPLYRTAHGVVFRCRGCGRFHVVFGPVVLAYETRGFLELRRLVETLNPEQDPAAHIGERCYHLQTESQQVGLAFTPAEIEELRTLLSGAAAAGLDARSWLGEGLRTDARA